MDKIKCDVLQKYGLDVMLFMVTMFNVYVGSTDKFKEYVLILVLIGTLLEVLAFNKAEWHRYLGELLGIAVIAIEILLMTKGIINSTYDIFVNALKLAGVTGMLYVTNFIFGITFIKFKVVRCSILIISLFGMMGIVSYLGDNYIYSNATGNPLEIAISLVEDKENVESYSINKSDWDSFIDNFGSIDKFETDIIINDDIDRTEKIKYKWKSSSEKYVYIIDFWYVNDKGEDIYIYTYKGNGNLDDIRTFKKTRNKKDTPQEKED